MRDGPRWLALDDDSKKGGEKWVSRGESRLVSDVSAAEGVRGAVAVDELVSILNVAHVMEYACKDGELSDRRDRERDVPK